MSVVIVLEGAGPGSFTVAVSPLAELSACLHALTGSAHHPQLREWATAVTDGASGALRAGLHRFSPLWSALRWRGFYPGLDGTAAGGTGPVAGGLDEQLQGLAGLPVARFAELTAFACVSGYRGFDFSRLLHSAGQRAALGHAVAALSAERRALAAELLRDPERCRDGLLAFLDRCRAEFFTQAWADTEPELLRSAHTVRGRLTAGGGRGPAGTDELSAALASLSPDASRLTGPPRVVFDKLHHSVITPARTPVLLVPSRHNSPHLVVKNEPGLPPVLHYPVDAPEVGVTLARSRMLALTDPRRVRLCRLIARESMTTLDLAARLSMTAPQVSRHLRALRDLGLVRTERSGRFVLYRLDLAAVERLGQDVVTGLQH
ncbi:ArsR/SmtB family transcription factor [Streptomyces nigrescens]|uniref:ArsR/SmtB family transcription factor n=1 Tax=Streptomyces nigrescens TaxID=1920 RepID=UPI002253B380|nr:DUF5937 family protein [Streptomyces libani]MCX5445558.1 DUF5937 family protein [Streptomyces libani]